MPQWELLVTDGHVRAARWRAASKFVMTAAIFLIVLGLAGLLLIPKSTPSSKLVNAKEQFAASRRQHIAAFLASKGALPNPQPSDATKAFSPADVQNNIIRVISSLNKSNAMPSDVAMMEAKEFWDGNWRAGSIAAVSSRHTYLVGFYINQYAGYPTYGGVEPPISLARIYGLLRKPDEENTVWSFYCLNIQGAPPCGAAQSISPESIPATLYDLTPKEAHV